MTSRVSEAVRPAETETAILEAARDLLAEGGPSALSMRAVASRVGISATAIYNYFENKQALVKRVVSLGFERFDRYLQESVVGKPEGSAERLKSLGEAYVRFAFENREYFRVLFTMHSDLPQEIEELPEGGGYTLFRRSVVEAMESGAVRRADPDLLVLYLWTHVHGLVTLLLSCEPGASCRHSGEQLSAPDLLERFGDFIFYGLAPHESPVPETGTAVAS
jgi:AcrR family transcriptional regulator